MCRSDANNEFIANWNFIWKTWLWLPHPTAVTYNNHLTWKKRPPHCASSVDMNHSRRLEFGAHLLASVSKATTRIHSSIVYINLNVRHD